MAEGKHAPWRLWILIVLWVLQLLLLGYSLIIYIVALVAIAHWDEFDSLSKPSIVAVVINMLILVVSLALTIAEIVQVGRRKLTPVFYLISNTLKAVVWTGLTIASIVLTQRQDDYRNGTTTGITIVVTIILLCFFILPMIYGIIVAVKTKKARRAGGYKGVDPLLSNTGYSAQAPGNVELESQTHGVYNHQKDTRFESYRQSAVPSQPVHAQPQAYGAPAYDGTQQYQPPQQHQQTGYVS